MTTRHITNKKVWIEDLCSIFNKRDIIPNVTMTKNEKINTITRLVILVFILMVITKYPYSITFLLLSLIIILILYFINTKEYYSSMDYPTQYRNPLISQNSLSSKKMSIQPIITPRAHDKDVWSKPDYRHSAVNYNQARYDLSEQYESVEQKENYTEFDPRLASYTNFTLDKYGELCNPKVVVPPPQQVAASDNTTPIENVTPPPLLQPSVEKFGQRREGFNPPQRRERFDNVPPQQNNFNSNSNSNYTVIPEETEDDNNFVPNQDLLIPKTITSIYGEGAITNQERIKYLIQLQPNIYSYSDTTTPINSTLGISYTPENPPRVLDQVATPYGTYPLYHRIDPQLIRDENLAPERREELPRRTAWSAKYSMFDAGPGSVNIEDIYDPRFNGYGDEYRSYSDVNLGQVQYYYSDIDAYRYPNFGIRSKVDFVDYTDPMGRVLPEYDRQVGLNDIKQTVHDQYTADALYFREGLQERLMRKRNSELWQLRAMPHRKDARAGTFTSHF
jgi:hypothetical protein